MAKETQTQGKAFIGTSNIVLPVPRYRFPEPYLEKSRLHYYSTLFNSLEVNSSFYKVPMPATFAKWADEVSPGFRFTVKLSRDITHAKELLYPQGAVAAFLSAADRSGDKKGCLLIQFPASITVHYLDMVRNILSEIAAADPAGTWGKALEIRHASWYVPALYDLLEQHNACLVRQDMPRCKTPDMEQHTAFEYLRFHGPAGDYRGDYHPEFLEAQADDIRSWTSQGKDVYVYFNNTLGNAYDNARMLQDMVSTGS